MNSMRAVLTLAMMVFAGCDSGVDSSGRVAVSGAVTLDGRPVSAGWVTFIPDRNSDNPAASGPLDESGRFEIPAPEGPMPGVYTVELKLNPIEAKNKFRTRSPTDNQTFEETATIAAGSPAELSFDLSSPPARTARPR